MSKINFLEFDKPPRHKGGKDKWGNYEIWDLAMLKGSEDRKPYRVYKKPYPHVILDQNVPLRGWYKNKFEPRGQRPRPCWTEALLTQPYGGSCPIRCVFCYVNNGGRGYRSQGVVTVDPQYPEKIRKQLTKMKFGFNLYISSFTEAFQPLEKIYHNTERLSHYATEIGLPLFYLTRQVPPEFAWKYLKMNKYSYLQHSIITPDPVTYKKLSPRAASLDDLLASIREARRLGIYVSIQINPIMAGIITNDEIKELIDIVAKNGANHVIFKFVEMVSPAANAVIRRMHKTFPDRGKKFEELYSETIGAFRTIKESYRRASVIEYMEQARKSGVTTSTCYEYKYARDASGRITDKTGMDASRDFTTGAQCHGQRTPLHIKVTGDLFQPFEYCPDSGCLYCSDTHKYPPCGSIKLFKATALKPSDYKNKPQEMK